MLRLSIWVCGSLSDFIVLAVRTRRTQQCIGDRTGRRPKRRMNQPCVAFVASDCRFARNQRPGVLEALTLIQHHRSRDTGPGHASGRSLARTHAVVAFAQLIVPEVEERAQIGGVLLRPVAERTEREEPTQRPNEDLDAADKLAVDLIEQSV